jgi:hypothetical protein
MGLAALYRERISGLTVNENARIASGQDEVEFVEKLRL